MLKLVLVSEPLGLYWNTSVSFTLPTAIAKLDPLPIGLVSNERTSPTLKLNPAVDGVTELINPALVTVNTNPPPLPTLSIVASSTPTVSFTAYPDPDGEIKVTELIEVSFVVILYENPDPLPAPR